MDVSLENLGNGGVIEKFDHELKNVIANILDPNTPQDATREITIKVKLKPGKADRGMCSMEMVVASKLAPTTGISSTLSVGMSSTGDVAAREYLPVQSPLFPDPSNGKDQAVAYSENVIKMAATGGR